MRCGRFSWGGFLVLLGALFLLNNFGILSINIWQVFWPLLIIWWGLQLLVEGGRRPSSPSPPSPPITNEVIRYVIPIKGVEEAHIRLKHGGGRLEIHGTTAPDELLAGIFEGEGVKFEAETAAGDVLHLDMRVPDTAVIPPLPTGQNHWNFGLNEEVPISLNLDTGASQAQLDLQDLRLTELRLHSGADQTTLTLPAHAGYTLVQVESGVAEVHIIVPQGVAAHIRSRQGLSNVRVDEKRFPRVGNVYESEEYDEAENRVDIHINTEVSRVFIE
jgi:hypothetical protein